MEQDISLVWFEQMHIALVNNIRVHTCQLWATATWYGSSLLIRYKQMYRKVTPIILSNLFIYFCIYEVICI